MKNKDLSRFYPNAGKRGNDEFLRKSDGGGSGLPEVTAEDNGKTLEVEEGNWQVKNASYTKKTVFFSGNATVVDLG